MDAKSMQSKFKSSPFNLRKRETRESNWEYQWKDKEAFEKEIGIYGSSYTNTMMTELGVRLHFAAGSDKNIKLTTQDDLELFKAYLKAEKD